MFSIVVQGKLHAEFLTRLDYYKSIGPVIVSHWQGDDESLLANVSGVRLVKSEPIKSSVYNASNLYRQCVTTAAGMALVKTPYAIKVRTDESYSNLTALIAKVYNNPQKIVTSNLFFRKDKYWKFHPSDHLIAGRTVALSAMYGWAKQVCESMDTEYPEGAVSFSPEQMLTVCYLRARGIEPDSSRSVELMRQHFDVVRMSQLGEFVGRCNNCNPSVFTSEDLQGMAVSGGEVITHMGELGEPYQSEGRQTPVPQAVLQPQAVKAEGKGCGCGRNSAISGTRGERKGSRGG